MTLKSFFRSNYESNPSPIMSRFTSEGKGDYKICFDNSFSTFSNKVVFFEIFIEDGQSDDDDDEDHKLAMREDYKAMESQLDMTVEQFLVRFFGFCFFVFFFHSADKLNLFYLISKKHFKQYIGDVIYYEALLFLLLSNFN